VLDNSEVPIGLFDAPMEVSVLGVTAIATQHQHEQQQQQGQQQLLPLKNVPTVMTPLAINIDSPPLRYVFMSHSGGTTSDTMSTSVSAIMDEEDEVCGGARTVLSWWHPSP
jgi:hypothetical protein